MFGEAAARLCAAAAVLLGWRPDEFWNATPAELALALQSPEISFDAPDAETIARLKRRFPDRPTRRARKTDPGSSPG